jgi:hypothetical protein
MSNSILELLRLTDISGSRTDYVCRVKDCERSSLTSIDFQEVLVWRLLGWRLFLAPIVGPRKALDVGTGTGIWCHAFGRFLNKWTVDHAD